MIFGGGQFDEFKPSRRVFAGRGRSMLTFGEWKIAFISMAFGGAVAAGWFYERADGNFLLAQPSLTQPPLAETPLAVDLNAPAERSVEIASVAEEVHPVTTASAQITERAHYYIAQAAGVIDGDTFYLEGVEARIRLWGIDAPARTTDALDDATLQLSALIAGETLSCEHIGLGAHSDIIARCNRSDGGDLAEAMVESGAVADYADYSSDVID
ncbi:MAG: hypothetical protein KDE05_02860 [Parvularculaceae bacterium]|nr:hypothetical protein [Parvularculaceae bacterium]